MRRALRAGNKGLGMEPSHLSNLSLDIATICHPSLPLCSAVVKLAKQGHTVGQCSGAKRSGTLGEKPAPSLLQVNMMLPSLHTAPSSCLLPNCRPRTWPSRWPPLQPLLPVHQDWPLCPLQSLGAHSSGSCSISSSKHCPLLHWTTGRWCSERCSSSGHRRSSFILLLCLARSSSSSNSSNSCP